MAAPRRQLSHISHGREIRAHTLVAFHYYPGDVLRLEAGSRDRFEKSVETRVRLPVAVWKGRVDNGGVEIDDPGLLSRQTPGLLGAEGAPVEATLETDNPDFFLAAELE